MFLGERTVYSSWALEVEGGLEESAMVIAKLRPQASKLLAPLARSLAILPAWTYTIAGLAASLAYLVACQASKPLLAALLLLLSGLLDALDGSVARVRGEASPRGALLDSVVDRIEDAIYAYGLLLLGLPQPLVYLLLVLSLLFSYVRARYESLANRSLEGVGLMERGERVIAIAVIVLLTRASLALSTLLLAIAVAVTVIGLVWRFTIAYRSLPRAQTSPRA